MKSIKKVFQYGDHEVTIETGEIARQTDSSVIVSVEGTSVLVTAVGRKHADPGRDFFPLTVNYQEKTYAAGKIPGGFFKREGRPSEKETLTSRLIDRPVRPLFPKGFKNEVQVIATVISLNPEIDPDMPSLIGASAALSLSGMPFAGPLGCARVGYINNEYVLNPSVTSLIDSDLDLVVAGTNDAVLMVESEAKILSEEIMLGAVMYGHEQMQLVIEQINEMVEEVGKPKWEWSAPETDESLAAAVSDSATKGLTAAYTNIDKMERHLAISQCKESVLSEVIQKHEDKWSEDEIKGSLSKLEKNIVRNRVIDGEPRIDGRDVSTVRSIDVRVGVLPRTHGSALFTRGETQAIVVTTLGTGRDAQMIDALMGEYKDSFMLHYNFPPYCVGETGFVGSPKRREIGHGKLAKRGIQAVMPDQEEFPYVIRVVSEITESNGSSSMASVCGTSLSLMDAGVPIKAPVAGVAMGLVKEGEKFAVLTDILGDEDHLGDMDFKVAGTKDGVTALQMDIKVQGITADIMESALEKAKSARLHILEKMNAVISGPKELSDSTPAMKKITVHQDKIKEIIGKGGAVIKGMQADTGASVDVNDDGVVTIFGETQSIMLAALEIIEGIIEDPELDKIYEGKVVKIVDFGAFVNILPGKDGLLHVSEISSERVENVSDVLTEGDIIKVKLIGFDRGKMKLSKKAIED